MYTILSTEAVKISANQAHSYENIFDLQTLLGGAGIALCPPNGGSKIEEIGK